MAGKLLATGERHEVIEEHAGAVVGPLPDATSERDEKRDRRTRCGAIEVVCKPRS